MPTADDPLSGSVDNPDDDLDRPWLAARLLARMALAHSRGERFRFAAELDGADPDGHPVVRGRRLDAAAFAAGGLLLVQQLEAELAALRGTPVPVIALGTVLIAEAQLTGQSPAAIPIEIPIEPGALLEGEPCPGNSALSSTATPGYT